MNGNTISRAAMNGGTMNGSTMHRAAMNGGLARMQTGELR